MLSQYPLRRASSWRLGSRNSHILVGTSQYPLRRASSWRGAQAFAFAEAIGLNTLSGGHPLGGQDCTRRHADKIASQYPLRRASSWRGFLATTSAATTFVSIPSQAGILLAVSHWP